MAPPNRVRRRHVFYVAGFDPNGPGRYHRLYSDGARQQAAFDGVAMQVGPRKREADDTVAWTVQYAPGTAGEVDTAYIFPRWDGIVRDYWWRGLVPQVLDLFRTSWQYLCTGALWKMYRQSWGPFINAFAPFLLLVLLVPGLYAVVWAGLGLAAAWAGDEPVAGPAAALAAVLALGAVWAYWARRHWHTQWILRSYAFTGRMGRGPGIPALEERLDAMAEALCRQVRQGGERGEDDEVLVVGHSLGTMLAVSVLARAFRLDPELARRGPALGLLTLGHLTPMLSDLPAARRFRDELALLAAVPELCWVDFSDPADAYCFAGVDPVAAAGITAPRAGHPQVRSPDFLAGLSHAELRRRSQHDVHAQYLCACAQSERYDYFAMTAGPLTLAQRFGAAR